MRVYLSGPISNQTFAGASGWRDYVAGRLNGGMWTVLDPMRGKSFLSNQEKIEREFYEADHNPVLSDEALVARDTADVVSCDIILVNFIPANGKVSQGTIHELALARYLHKIVVVVMEDGNVHDHPFNRVGVIRFKSLESAVDYILSCGV